MAELGELNKTPRSKVTFWIPATLLLSIIWLGSCIIWYFFGPVIGLGAGFIMTTGMTLTQLYFLFSLDRWLDAPEETESMPEGWGTWRTVYSHLYRLRHEEEKNRRSMNEWLTRFREAMNFLPDGVAIMNDMQYLNWCNPMMEKHLGLDLKRDRDMRITNVVREPEFIDYLILGRFQKPLEIVYNNRALTIQMVPFGYRSQILVSHDRTEAIKTDKIRRDFVSNASREMRAPVNAISEALTAAIGTATAGSVPMKELQTIEDRLKKLQVLVNDMLILTSVESNEFPPKSEPVSVNELLQQVRSMGEELSQGRHHILIEMDGPDTIYSDMDELRLAFSHLVTNAVRYTPDDGTVTLIWTQNEEGPRFSVWDTGIGIDDEHIPLLTKRFYQVDKTNSVDGGTGLGLAIVNHVLNRHEARLEVHSQVGRGSQFSIQFSRRLLVP